jgi:hypothetical protein
VVYETGNVNTLQVENLSPTDDVFIHAGEIVMGGKQDRTFGVDMIVQAKSGKVSIPGLLRRKWPVDAARCGGFGAIQIVVLGPAHQRPSSGRHLCARTQQAHRLNYHRDTRKRPGYRLAERRSGTDEVEQQCRQ